MIVCRRRQLVLSSVVSLTAGLAGWTGCGVETAVTGFAIRCRVGGSVWEGDWLDETAVASTSHDSNSAGVFGWARAKGGGKETAVVTRGAKMVLIWAWRCTRRHSGLFWPNWVSLLTGFFLRDLSAHKFNRLHSDTVVIGFERWPAPFHRIRILDVQCHHHGAFVLRRQELDG